MTTREKALAGATGSLFAVMLLALVVRGLVLKPAAELDAAYRTRHNHRAELRKKRDKMTGRLVPALVRYAEQTFGTDELQAQDNIRNHLTKLIARSGVVLESLQAVSGQRTKGYREIGRTIQARGTLEQAINLLFLLQAQPTLHHVENVSIRPVRNSPQVELTCRYTTLLVNLPSGVDANGVAPGVADTHGELDSPRREVFDLIVQRDLFRPYMPRPAQPAVARRTEPRREKPTEPKPEPPAAASPPEAFLKVVSLSEWSGEQDVSIQDTRSGEVRTFHPGQRVLQGEIVMVDYRALPDPDDPDLTSPSRVILKYGRDYWAVELGQTLAEKRRLKPGQLPPALRDSARRTGPSRPGSGTSRAGRAKVGPRARSDCRTGEVAFSAACAPALSRREGELETFAGRRMLPCVR